ncbi:MAG TPA: DUF2789 domain-containing protein [Aquabacterium sp.]|jgi:hypothetical protein|uniref:DUF2789 domain-containing protein n=1 Tax=Aquabacterium sp. TaxID=1872578 RepID=UPI002D880E8C|nr:DUF2789 domain-containing protein [Aquabacterium sp.]HET6789271.1 DUF2789 domain-containing protein [Aquabacterium sp.]HEX5373287.1 DUF2789 domain-containing protein [Aquabacterium sp.]
MEASIHTLSELFRQLGLPDSRADISYFIARHRPLPQGMALADAPFWAPYQAQFLRDELSDDADWAELVDLLDATLRHPGPPQAQPALWAS